MQIYSEKCDFGVHLDEDCNKLHYVCKSGIRPFSSIESETQDLLLYSSGLKYKSIKSTCFHHEAKPGFAFEKRSTNVVIHLRSIRSTSKVGKRYQRTLPRHF